jgi:hypothetical protein
MPVDFAGALMRCPACRQWLRVPPTDATDAPRSMGRTTARRFGTALIGAALLGSIPAAIHVVGVGGTPESTGIARWACALLLVTTVEIAYGLYIRQLPDWSTLWVGSLVALTLAGATAALLGMVTLAGAGSPILDWLELAVPDAAPEIASWSLLLLGLLAGLACWSGRAAVRWQRSVAPPRPSEADGL